MLHRVGNAYFGVLNGGQRAAPFLVSFELSINRSALNLQLDEVFREFSRALVYICLDVFVSG